VAPAQPRVPADALRARLNPTVMFPDRAMGKIKSWRLSAAFVISLLGVGISFWQIPYSKLNVPDALYGPGLVVVFILALLLRVFAVAPFLKVMNVLAASVSCPPFFVFQGPMGSIET
jgi:hypothetical protein